jgi:MSHA pilin protein MshA
MRSPQHGFTLIELVFVIVIIGILAAFAIPKFVDLTTDARAATAHGMLGTVRSAAEQVKALAIAQGKDDDATSTVTVEGAPVTIAFGYPTANAAGIGAAVQIGTSGFTPDTATVGTVEWEVTTADTPDNCKAAYDWTTPVENGRPAISEDVTDC